MLPSVAELDLRSPFDELSELRRLLTTQEIAELTGLRRETISRARRDRRLRRSTAKSLGDLYAVTTAVARSGDRAHLAAVLRRPQQEFGGRSIAELLREGKVDEVLQRLGSTTAADRRLEELPLDPETLAALGAGEGSADGPTARSDTLSTNSGDPRLVALLEADPALADLLPSIEARIRDHFGADAQIERAVVADPDDADGGDRLYLRVSTGLSFEQEVELLTALLDQEEARLEPFRDRLTVGIS
jgi:hypothetical protein